MRQWPGGIPALAPLPGKGEHWGGATHILLDMFTKKEQLGVADACLQFWDAEAGELQQV